MSKNINSESEVYDSDIEQLPGGGGTIENHLIVTGITPACRLFIPGSNFYNRKLQAVTNTCGACINLTYCKGWHVCECRNS